MEDTIKLPDSMFEEKGGEAGAPSKVTVGGKEYDQEDLSALVGLGEIAKEAETKYNTKIDRVWPEFSKAQNKVKEYEARIAELEDYKTKTTPVEVNDDTNRQALDMAKKLGIVTKEDFTEYMDKTFRPLYQRERAAERLLEECEDLETEFDGTDGRPKFQKEGVLDYMQQNGIRNPQKAYKLMHEDALDSWKEQQLGKTKKPGLVTETSSSAGSKRPAEVKVTRDNLNQLVSEALS
ncbi:MAG: hypothetical protein AAB922_04900 [Patescibacteria group bacterium]